MLDELRRRLGLAPRVEIRRSAYGIGDEPEAHARDRAIEARAVQVSGEIARDGFGRVIARRELRLADLERRVRDLERPR